MPGRKHKKNILLLLDSKDWEIANKKLEIYQIKDLIGPLFSALCSSSEMRKWHAVSSFGVFIPQLANDNLEAARIIMRRFLWSLNDESGGIGWGAPESMAEIMAHHDGLFSEYVHMLISYMRHDGEEILQDGNFLELPALQQGLLWAIGRLLLAKRVQMLERGVASDLKWYLQSEDNIVRGLACWCIGLCKDKKNVIDLSAHTTNATAFNLYLDGTFKKVSVSELALSAISGLSVLDMVTNECN